MAPATSSRRRTNRRQASDEIEEDNVVAQRSEDERPSRKSNKKVAKKEKTMAVAEQEEDSDDDDGSIDLAEFQNQPLAKSDAAKLKGLATDWETVKSSIKLHASPLVKDVATSAAEYLPKDQANKALIQLEIVMKELLDLDAEMGIHQKMLDDLYQTLYQQEEEITDVVGRYQTETSRLVTEYQAKTTRQKYLKNDRYIEYKQDVYESQHEEAPPPMTELIPKEDGDVSDDDDDLEMGGVVRDYKCPLSLTLMVNPYTSSVCHHSYSYDAIKDYFKQKTVQKCPAAGCGRDITMSNCTQDKDLAKKVEAARRREARRRANEDDDAESIVSDD